MLQFLFPIQKFKISGHSMEPTIKDGGTVLVNRLAYLFRSPEVGDIVAANIGDKVFIKRIISVKQNKYFLSGDNSEDSRDSRQFGMVSKARIMGKVIRY